MRGAIGNRDALRRIHRYAALTLGVLGSHRPDGMEPRGTHRYAARAVPLRVNLERVLPDTPDAAVERAVGPLWNQLATRRPLLIGVSEVANGPGVGIAPWTRAGLSRAATRHHLTARGVALRSTPRGLTASAALGDLEDDASGPSVSLDLPGTRRPRRIPTRWFGAHLCLVVPCVFIQQDGPFGAWLGPAAEAFASLDRCCTVSHLPPPGLLTSSRGSTTIVPTASLNGARLAAHVFASTTLVIDAAWWAPVHRGDGCAPELNPLGLCLATGVPHPDERWTQGCVQALDLWLTGQLQDTVIEAVGSAAGDPWHRVSLPRARNPLRQTVRALWGRAGTGAPAERRLPPAIPGPLAKCWHGYPRSHALRGVS